MSEAKLERAVLKLVRTSDEPIPIKDVVEQVAAGGKEAPVADAVRHLLAKGLIVADGKWQVFVMH